MRLLICPLWQGILRLLICVQVSVLLAPPWSIWPSYSPYQSLYGKRLSGPGRISGRAVIGGNVKKVIDYRKSKKKRSEALVGTQHTLAGLELGTLNKYERRKY